MGNKVRISAEGTPLSIAGGRYRILVRGAETGGKFAVIEMRVPPGSGPVPHRHPGFTETFYVAEGAVEFQSESGKMMVEKGGFVTIPEDGEVHAFKNRSGSDAVLLCTVMPSGLEVFFEKADAVAREFYGEDLKLKMKELATESGQELFGPDFFN